VASFNVVEFESSLEELAHIGVESVHTSVPESVDDHEENDRSGQDLLEGRFPTVVDDLLIVFFAAMPFELFGFLFDFTMRAVIDDRLVDGRQQKTAR